MTCLPWLDTLTTGLPQPYHIDGRAFTDLTCIIGIRQLAEANLKSKRPFLALPLTPEHQQLRLQWCQARSMWNVTDWQKVVFSDESRFVLGTDDNRVRVWRRPGPILNGLTEAIFQPDNALPYAARLLTSFSDSFMASPLPRFVPCTTRGASAKTADAIVSLCGGFRVGFSIFVGPSASKQHKVSNQHNAGSCGSMYCSWRWSNALLNLLIICVVAHPVFV
ncbi:transposable element Tcb2 transposase [Trichonephila clavipes]|nr:transposable element Tcb2 transposase [Trichonephila clavipes]